MAAVLKSILAAALLLVCFGAPGAVWASGSRFAFPPDVCRSGQHRVRPYAEANVEPLSMSRSKPLAKPIALPVAVPFVSSSLRSVFPEERAAFTEHIWVNPLLVDVPTYVDAAHARIKAKAKPTAAEVANRRAAVTAIMARLQKGHEAGAPEGKGSGGGQRFKFEPAICRFGSSDRGHAAVLPTSSPLSPGSPTALTPAEASALLGISR